MRRWPIRIRLTAAFTVLMALVLLGVGFATVTHTRSSLDSSITEALTYRLRDLQPVAGAPVPELSGISRDTGEQVLDPAGRVIASSPEVAGTALLSPAELASAHGGLLLADHAAAGTVDGPARIAAGPTGDGSRTAVVAVTLSDRDTAVAGLRRELLIAFPLVLLAAGVGAYLLAAFALRPVERMRGRAAALTASTSERLPLPPARDKISRLGTTFNDLLDRLHAALKRERRFVADASHELRTPLSLLTTELELALRRPRTAHELTTALGSALEETERLSRLAQDLLLLARSDQTDTPAPPDTVVELRPALESVITRYRTAVREHDVILDCAAGLSVRADPDDLDRAVSNLIDNALRHGGPPIIVIGCPASGEAADAVTITVGDHGPGFDPDFLPRAFERFTRADNARSGGGTGLGLAIVAALAGRNGGHATAANQPDRGSAVTITLPAPPTSGRP
ncbi:HAMP domain-containing protein [Amycolatopsis sp. K13G38]|uniref:histidine kinase n=1 Tax=Amycolatopsis acididurans TaxID=2724524 RepID=A0ABX1JAY8_9PSEU|nr:ATP-binding protein [Amycolatopsis acididurans]NKQ56928.1 HAMP domain-containing protein [Amycolatopsis acididurans]